MQLTMGVMCDYAAMDVSGKLNLIGVFTSIHPRALPFTHSMLFLALKLNVSKAEWGSRRNLCVKLIGADRPTGFQVGPFEFEIPADQPSDSGDDLPMIIRVDNLVVEQEGEYHWSVLIDNREEGTFRLSVRKRES
jgi:hypothetical protein